MINNTITKVFLVVGVMVGIFIAWQLLWANNGVLKTAYNGAAEYINDNYATTHGDGSTLLPTYDDSNLKKLNSFDASDFGLYHYEKPSDI